MGYGLSPDFTQEPIVIFGRANQLTLKNNPSNNAVVFSVDSNGLLTVTTPVTGGVTFSGGPLTFANAVTFSSTVQFNGVATFAANVIISAARVQAALGASVPSASHLTLGNDGNTFPISGTTTINLLDTTGWQIGSEVTLYFTGALTVKNNQAPSGTFAPMLLSGNVDFVEPGTCTLTLKLIAAGAWIEIAHMTF